MRNELIVSCAIILKPKKAMIAPPSLGQVLNAFFLERVKVLDSTLAEVLHKPAPLKPFTVSPLFGKVEFENNRWRFYAEEKYVFRVTSIFPELSQWLKDVWAPSLPLEVELAGVKMDILDWTFNPRESAWAGNITYDEIFDSSNDNFSNKTTLKFLSPTTFKSQGRNYPLPDTSKVFGHLIQKWNQYANINILPNDLRDIIDNYFFIREHKVQTRIMHFDSYKQVGFTGICSYGAGKKVDKNLIKIVNVLSEFAFYSGIGYKTTMGMGQVKKIN